MPLKSKIQIVRHDLKALRTSIPEGIVDFLQLKAGDYLDWEMQYDNDKRYVKVYLNRDRREKKVYID